MKSNLYQVGGTQVLSVQDAVTQAECAEVKDLLSQAVAGGGGRVALDLSEVPFLDSAALEMLLQTNKECVSKGGRLKLVSPSPNCQEILRLTDLKTRFEIAGSVEEASRKV